MNLPNISRIKGSRYPNILSLLREPYFEYHWAIYEGDKETLKTFKHDTFIQDLKLGKSIMKDKVPMYHLEMWNPSTGGRMVILDARLFEFYTHLRASYKMLLNLIELIDIHEEQVMGSKAQLRPKGAGKEAQDDYERIYKLAYQIYARIIRFIYRSAVNDYTYFVRPELREAKQLPDNEYANVPKVTREEWLQVQKFLLDY